MTHLASRWIGLAVACAAAAATLGAAAPVSADRPAAAATVLQPPAAARDASAITVRRSRFGRVLFDRSGHALYLFTRERTTRPRCYGACAEAWPPFVVERKPSAGAGARGSLIGTTRRRDGTRQATYRGHPLYYYVDDRRPGQILCHDVFEFGGRWLVVRPNGKAAGSVSTSRSR
jgi:predicted lipoprotein with Yx(FWY)xxD motif